MKKILALGFVFSFFLAATAAVAGDRVRDRKQDGTGIYCPGVSQTCTGDQQQDRQQDQKKDGTGTNCGGTCPCK